MRPHRDDLSERHDRAVRRLAAELECLASVSERTLAESPALRERALALGAATRHAVALDLLGREEAERIWSEVRERHPQVAWCRDGCPGLAA